MFISFFAIFKEEILNGELKKLINNQFLREWLGKVYSYNLIFTAIVENIDLKSANDLRYMDKKIKHWFAMKLNVKMNENISPLPAGLENLRYLHNGIVKNFVKTYKKENQSEKNNKVLNIY